MSKEWIAAIALVFTVIAVNFATMPRFLYAGDPYAWREEARSLILDGRFEVAENLAKAFGESGQFFVKNKENKKWFSKYGIMNTLLAVPPLAAEYLWTGRLSS